ncbi:MAG: alpha/beta hydrolase [Candidatus Thermoplasmatota archaeon]|nr:alpha/beta hydrolase [Candidatus Thermoplasmatota archaeon]
MKELCIFGSSNDSFLSSMDFGHMFDRVTFMDYPSVDSMQEFKKENRDLLVILGLPEHSERVMSMMINFNVNAAVSVSPDFNPELKYRLSRIESPLMIVNGSDDEERFLKSGRMYHDYIENSTLKVLKKCGHFPYRDRKESFFLTLKRFLEDAL